MKKVLFVSLLVLMAQGATAAITNVALDWSSDVAIPGATSGPSCVAYNPHTNHFLICNYAKPEVVIANNTDGSLTGGSLSLAGLKLGTLGVFSICVSDDGAIYGGTNILSDGVTPGNSLIRWANESDPSPTQQDPAPMAGSGIPMEFPRAMDAIGSGADTVIGITGSNDYKVTFLTTSDGSTFSVADCTLVAPVTAEMQIKQGVALVPSDPLNKVYGTKADGAGEVCCLIKEATWVASPTFSASPSYTAPPGGLGAASPIGYSEPHDAVFVIGYSDAANDYMTVLDGTTGAGLFQFQIGRNVNTYGYGSVELLPYDGEGYFGARSATTGSFVCGKVSFDPAFTPTPAYSPTPTPTETPLPPEASVGERWNSYR